MSGRDTQRRPDDLELRVLGPMEVWRGAERQNLPRSKKSRALLAYLAITQRNHRRERLCDLLWDITDDPRGALRWSLSRLRKAIAWDRDRLVGDRHEVGLDTEGMQIDAVTLSECVSSGVQSVDTDTLSKVALLPRGTFLEELQLPDFMGFDAWCVAQRERFRKEHCVVLGELVSRLGDDPERALPFAREWIDEDSLGVEAQCALLRLLVAAGHSEEAETRFANCRRLFTELGASGLREIETVWLGLQARVAAPRTPARPVVAEQPKRPPTVLPFVGREKELSLLEQELAHARDSNQPRIVLVTAEPGGGKTRLAERLMDRAASAGVMVMMGKAYETESTRPYSPWLDAIETDVSALIGSLEAGPRDRSALVGAIMERVAARSEGNATLIVLDDLQWLDRDSVDLLHSIAVSYSGPLCIVLLARGGELNDNEVALRALRSLRRSTRVTTVELEPLTRVEIANLLVDHESADVETVFAASGGNPLYAIELARAEPTRSSDTPLSVIELVRDRIALLPDHAVDVLKWGAVLGHALGIERLEGLCSQPLEEIVDALERLERHAFLRIDATRRVERYLFSHDVVREAVYSDLSLPRRRLMHKKIASLLAPEASDAAVATEIAHHASQAGEALPGVKACLVAGHQSLRVFANGDAEALARRGLRLAEDLDEADRIAFSLELLHLQYSARPPDRARAAEDVRVLANRALDLGLTHAARLGFQTLSFLRWESSSMAAAHENIMQAERVSRSGEPPERCSALSQAAKCLVLLERKLSQAEAFLLEVEGLSTRGVEPSATAALARGMLAAHRGDASQAVEAFQSARTLARQHGDRLTEFAAIEQWAIFEIDRGDGPAALELAQPLADLGAKVRPGVEAPSGRAVLCLARLLSGDAAAAGDMAVELQALRELDDKYHLAVLLSRQAHLLVQLGQIDTAAARAAEALAEAESIGRQSEIVYAHAVLAACRRAAGDAAGEQQHRRLLGELAGGELSWSARRRADGAPST